MMNDTLIEDLRCLRVRLTPILSDRFKKVLIDAEKRLSGGGNTPAANLIKLPKKKKPTTKELYHFFNNEGL